MTSDGVIRLPEILERIPHRPPFLFLDCVESLEAGVAATGVTTFAADAPAFRGHFPGAPIVPGVILIECIAQLAAIVLSEPAGPSDEGHRPGQRYLAKVERVVFAAPVVPGDTLRVDVRVVRRLGQFVKVRGRIRRAETRVMDGEIVLYESASHGHAR